MRYDRFWEIFLGTLAGIVCATVGFFFFRIYAPSTQPVTLAAAITTGDPFEHAIVDTVSLSPFLYREALPARFDDWSWDAVANWRSIEEHQEGAHSIRADFKLPWGGVRSSGPSIPITAYNSISLAVYPASDVGDLYIELYDIYGRSLGEQSIGWYLPSHKLLPASWQEVSIPIANIVGSVNVRQISGFSVSAQKPGTAFIDNVYLSKDLIAHERWDESLTFGIGPVDPFKDAAPSALPYSMSFVPAEIQRWKSLFGRFDPETSDVKVGALPEKTNGSMAVFTGGLAWSDYRVDAEVHWGPTNTFSLLVRFTDDGNFVSCAFSEYGATVQIYQVKKGESFQIAQSPGLPIPDYEPWKDVKHGASVRGNKVTCYLYGEKVLSADIPSMPQAGSVGIETWTRGSYDYPHLLKSLSVNELN